jgi:hypothetical protein
MRPVILLVSIITFSVCRAQDVKVYKAAHLLQRISSPDTIFVVNFWATWCKPCVQELPVFDSITAKEYPRVKVMLVCLDFAEDIKTKVIPFLKRTKIRSECVLLDEVDGNAYIDHIDRSWTGAIPATLIKHGDSRSLLEGKVGLKKIRAGISRLR